VFAVGAVTVSAATLTLALGPSRADAPKPDQTPQAAPDDTRARFDKLSKDFRALADEMARVTEAHDALEQDYKAVTKRLSDTQIADRERSIAWDKDLREDVAKHVPVVKFFQKRAIPLTDHSGSTFVTDDLGSPVVAAIAGTYGFHFHGGDQKIGECLAAADVERIEGNRVHVRYWARMRDDSASKSGNVSVLVLALVRPTLPTAPRPAAPVPPKSPVQPPKK
jgi:hypothetical protein